MTAPVVIAGASVAGVRIARALRAQGMTTSLILLSDEQEMPYDRPPLSKQFLAAGWDESRLDLLTREDAVTLDIELRLGTTALSADAGHSSIMTSDGETITYSHLVVTTGAAARTSPWGTTPGIHVLRSRQDASAIREDLSRGGRLVVVGGGFIGAEVAAAAHGLGLAVTVVDPMPSPMSRSLGEAMGQIVSGLHDRKGVEARFGVGVDGIAGSHGDFTIALSDGSTLHADFVVVGIGAVPNDEWLRSSGLLVDDGLVCDEFCRALGADNVYAAGDVARWWHPTHGRTVRVEHWTNAIDQAECVARNIMNPHDLTAYAPIEYVWSDQYDWKVQVAGDPRSARLTSLLGDEAAEKPKLCGLFARTDGQVVGAVAVNWPKALLECRRIIADSCNEADAADRLSPLLTTSTGPEMVARG